MSSGRDDLRERLRIDEVRDRATELYERTVESSDRTVRNASRRAETAVSGVTDDRFDLSRWLGSNTAEEEDDGDASTADSGQTDDSSTAADGARADDASPTGSTGIDAEFDFRGWLADGADDVAALDGTATGTEGVDTDDETAHSAAQPTASESSPAEPAEFDFARWVRAGDTDLDPIGDPTESTEEPVETDDELAEPVADASDAVGSTSTTAPAGMAAPVQTGGQAAGAAGFDRAGAPSPTALLEMHPVKGAVLALFLAFVALAVLSMVGYLPPLGPSTGLAF